MNKALRMFSIALFAAVFCGSFGAADARAQVLNEILNRMDGYNKKLRTLQAAVTMEKYESGLKITDTTEGTLKYLPKNGRQDMYARIDWTRPLVEHIAVVGNSYTLYRPRLNQVLVGKTGGTKNKVPAGALSFMSMSKTQLKNSYTVKYLGEEKAGGSETWHLELTPKTEAGYQRAHLWVNKNGLPIAVRIVEKNDDTTTVRLSGVKENETLKAEVFVIDYPSSAKKIKG